MRRVGWGLLAVLAFACGGSSNATDGGNNPGGDNAPPFVGPWTGTLTETETAPSAGAPESTDVSLVITETGANTLSLAPFCPDGSSVTAQVTSATEFSIPQPYSCPAATVSSCASVVLNYQTLTGTLSSGMLFLAGSLTAAGCGFSASANVTFTGDAGTK